MKKTCFFVSLLSIFFLVAAHADEEQHWPNNILMLDPVLTHHVLIAEKSTHKLYLYRNNDSFPELVKTYDMVTGKKMGNKIFEGDHRTPEGVYFMTEFLSSKELLRRHGELGKQYGVGAFVLDYPNYIDKRDGKTGGGIWLHSTDDESRINQGLDSRGCFVVKNNDLKEISKNIEISKTVLISVHEMNYISKSAWLQKRKEIHDLIANWEKYWSDEDLDKYISCYHPTDFYDQFRGNLHNYKNYKRAVFANVGKPTVKISNLSILGTSKYMIATFVQNYSSSTISDIGHKTLYLKQNDYYEWKIAYEMFKKISDKSSFMAEFDDDAQFFDED